MFFNPKSIAIIGASPDEQSINGRALKFILKHQYRGELYLVNPKYREINGIKVYPDIASIPVQVDLAIFVVAAKRIPPLFEQCREKGVPFAIIYSSGFSEAGEEGARLQNYLTQATADGKIRILGPNCQGMFNVVNRVAASFSAALDYPDIKSGPVGFVSQSGAMGYSMYSVLQEDGIGFSCVVSTGNEADLEAVEVLTYLADDDHTKILVGYVEGFKKPERLYELAEESLKREKPVIIYKVGSSEIGAKAAASHTAALAGSDALYGRLFEQLGMVRVSDTEEISDLCRILVGSKPPQGKRVGIVTTSGGAGVILADQCAVHGLEVPGLTENTRAVLQRYLPAFGSDLNPVDVTAQIASSEGMFNESLKAVADDPNIDILIVALTMVTGPRSVSTAQFLVDMWKRIEKPLVILWTAGDSLAKPGLELLKKAQLPFFKSPQRCIRAISKFVKVYETFNKRDEILRFIADRRETRSGAIENPGSLYEYEAKKWLGGLGLPVTLEFLAATADEAAEYAERIGFPVALKVQSRLISHKTEAGGVVLNLSSKEEVYRAFHTIKENALKRAGVADIEGVLVQEMVTGGQEVIIGASHDDQLGPCVLFGLGGTFVEVLKDYTLAVPPLSREDALRVIESIRGYPLLAGIRGQAGVDIDALAELLSRFSYISAKLKGDIQIDLNPVVVSSQGVKIVDALVMDGGNSELSKKEEQANEL
jgi:acetyltransferase